jgi:hypothetical protein
MLHVYTLILFLFLSFCNFFLIKTNLRVDRRDAAILSEYIESKVRT